MLNPTGLLLLLLLMLFSTADAATVTLHPSGNAANAGTWTSSDWVNNLDSNDGDTSTATKCCSGPTLTFYENMDDPSGLSGATINSITLNAVVKCSAAGVLTTRVGYMTDGATTVWTTAAACGTAYATVSSSAYTTDSAGGALDLTDLNNLQLSLDRVGTGPTSMTVTELYAVVDYTLPTNYYVGTTADVVDGTTDCTNSSNTTCSLREAVSAANAGTGPQIINIPAGTYTTAIAGTGEESNATGDFDVVQTTTFVGAGMNSTIIDGGALDRVFHKVTNSNTLTFQNMTIQNGSINANGGCIFNNTGNVVVSNVKLTNCHTTVTGAHGGAIFASDLNATNSTFSYNATDATGAADADGGAVRVTTATLNGGNLFNFNTTAGTGAWGGAIFAVGALTFSGTNTFEDNHSAANGGAIASTNATTTISGAVFNRNTATNYGGAVSAWDGGTTCCNLVIQNSTFDSNQAEEVGGATQARLATTITNSTFTNNIATGAGGTKSGRAGAVWSNNAVTVTGSHFSGNQAQGSNAASKGDGGAIWSSGASTIKTSSFENNSAGHYGGGVFMSAVALTVSNTTFSGNVAANSGGATYHSTGTYKNSTFYNNSATAGTSNSIHATAASATLYNTIMHTPATGTGCNNTVSSATNSKNILYNGSCFTAQAGDLTSDPLLYSLSYNGGTTKVHALQPTSPAIGVGNTTTCNEVSTVNNLDQQGITRNSGNGLCDIGASEYQGINSTTVGAATAVLSASTSITVTMPYTNDGNSNNTYTVDYKLSGAGSWTNWVTAAAHATPSYSTVITGLSQSSTYEVRVTYNDADGVTGTNPQTFTGIVTGPFTRAVPSSYSTIQAAINASYNGDTVQVADGTYSENINFNGKLVTVISQNGAAVTTIQGATTSTNSPVVTFSTSETSAAVLDGFTIDNQATANTLTRGIYIYGASPTIKNSIIKGNAADNTTSSATNCNGGGGMCVINGAPTLNSITVKANGALNRHGCGIFITGAAGGATITNSTIGGTAPADGNLCTNGSGGGIYYESSTTGTLSISNSNIQYNQGNTNGGGIFATTITNQISVSNTTILNNFTGTSGDGGGVYVMTNTPIAISNSTISNNIARSGVGILVFNGADVTITGTTTIDNNDTNNCTSGDGGGIYATTAGSTVSMTGGSITNNAGRYGSGVYVTASADITLTGVTINSNSSACGTNNGGGIHANGGTLTADRSIIRGNSGANGGGVYAWGGATVTIKNSDITGNVATTDGGGAMVSGTTTLNIYNSTVAGNYAGAATTGNGGGGIRNATATLNITNGIVYGNTGNTTDTTKYGISSSGTTSINYSSYQSMFGACTSCANNRTVGENPLLTNLQQAGSGAPTTAGDFHLQATSPVIDQGTNNGYSPDIDSDSRPQGAGYEMGSDEVVPVGSNNTTVGVATAVNGGTTRIDVSMPYTDDANGNNTYTVDYKLTSEPTVWTNWVTAAAHVATPYSTTITGLTQGASYDVRVTYNDADTVSGTNPQTITGIVTAPIIRAVPGTYGTIQAAIDASNNGDTVQVANGTYSENINFNNKLVTVISQNGAALTKIQGTGANSPVVTFSSGETASAVLDGFTIDNQAAASTATRGIYISASSAPTLKNLILEGNQLSGSNSGGGVYINGGSATIQTSTLGGNAANKNTAQLGSAIYATALSAPLSISNTTISENASSNSGALYLTANGAQTTTLTTVTFTNNTTTNAGGAAIYNDTSILSISGSAFNTNTTAANMHAGAIMLNGTTASASISNTTFTGNSSGNYGGAIYVTGSTAASPLTITGSTFTNNGTGATYPFYGGAIALNTVTNATVISSTTITGGHVTNRGGGIYATSAPLTLTGVNITNNTSDQEGGGLYLLGAATVASISGGTINGNSGTNGGGIYISGATLNTSSGAAISSNTASSTTGGGISINGSSTVTLTKTTLSGNRANQRGGGIAMALSGGTVTLTNCNVTGNSADMQAYSNGGGIYDAGGVITLMNTTVAGNYATQSAAGFAAADADDVITNSIFWGNTAGATPEISGTPTVTYSDVSGGFAGTGNINSDPLFVTLAQASSGNPTTAGNFHLQAASPAKNVGTATGAPADDVDGDTRSSVDMGSDEYIGANNAPVGGYTADNVIPTAQVVQSTDGLGVMTITWKGRDNEADNVTIKTFQYSVDGGSTWNAPTNGDASAALSTNWNNNGGAGWSTATTLAAATAHSFTFNTKHADVTGMNGIDQSDVQVRFLLNDGTVDSAASATSQSFQVDDLNPAATIVSATYSAATDTMVITGTNFTTIATATTDIKGYVDWTKFVWDINGDDATTANITVALSDVTSLTVTDATTLTLVFTGAKGTAIEGTAGYGSAGGADTIDVTAGFSKDYFGNAATTDGVANAPLGSTISGTVYTDEGVTTIANGTTIRLLVNGESVATTTTSSGAYSITTLLSAGDALVAYIDSNGGTVGNTVTVSSGATLSGLNIYADRVITRHDNSGSLTNALMNTALGAYSDTDILYSIATGNITVSGANTELFIWSGHTFAPGGTVTTKHTDVRGTFDAAANAVNVSGNWSVDATGVFISTGTVTFNATSGTNTITPGGVDANHDFQNIVFNDAAGTATFQLAGAIDLDGDLTVTDGIFDTTASNYAVTVAGALIDSANGRFKANASTITVGGNVSLNANNDATESTDFNSASVVMNGAASQITYTSLNAAWNNGINNLTVGQGGVTDTINSSLSILNDLTIGTGALTGAVTLYMRGTDGDVLFFDAASSLTLTNLTMLANAVNLPTLTNGYNTNIVLGGLNQTVTQTGAVTLNSGKHLKINGDGVTTRANNLNTGGFALTVGGDLIIGAGVDTGAKGLTANGSTISVAGNFTLNPGANYFSAGTSTLIMNGAANQTLYAPAVTFNNLTLNNTGAGGSDTITISLALDVNGVLTITDGVLNISTNNPAVNTAGNVTIGVNGSIDVTSRTANWTFDGTTTLTDSSTSGPQQLNNVVVGGALTLGSSTKMKSLTINATKSINLGASGYTLELTGTGTPLSNSGTFTAGTSTVKYTGTTTATNITTLPYSSLQLTPTAATTYSLTGNLTGANAMTGNLTIDTNATLDATATNYNLAAVNVTINGTYVAQASTITVSGSWNMTNGAFTYGTSTVDLTGTGSIINNNADWWNKKFYNLNAAAAGQTTAFNSSNYGVNILNTLTLGSGTLTNGQALLNKGSGIPFVNGGATLSNSSFKYDTNSTGTTITPAAYPELWVASSSGTPTFTLGGNVSCSSFIFYNNNPNTTATITLDTSGSNYSINCTHMVMGVAGATVPQYANLNLNGSTATFTGNVTINSNVTGAVTGGTLNVGGNWNNSGAFSASTGTVVFNGTNQSLTGSNIFNNFTKSVASAATLTFAAGSTTTVNGLSTLNGAAGQLLSLRSSTPGTRWNLNLAGTKSISYVDVQDSDASGSAVGNKPVNPANFTNNGNNISWFYPGIAGTVYTDENITTIADGATVRLLVNGSSAGSATTISGAYSITPSIAVNAGDAILAFIENNATNGTTVSVASGSDISGFNIYASRIITRQDNAGSLTNANMSSAKGSYTDTYSDIDFSVATGNLTVSGAGTELHVWATHSFTPGGTITTPKMHIAGTLDAAANAINVAGSWDATGGVFTSTGTVTFNATSGTNTITPGGVDANHDFQNIVFNDAAGTATFQLSGAIKANGTFTVTDGIVDTTASNYAVTVVGNFSQAAGSQFKANGSTLTVSGNFTADGSADGATAAATVSTNYNSAILIMNGSAKTLTFTNLTGNYDNGFYDLTAGQSGFTTTLANTLAVRHVLTVGTGTLTGAGQLYLRSIDANPDVLVFDPASNLSIAQLNFYSNTPENIPTLANWYDCNIMLAANGTVTQTGAVRIKSGNHLFITGNGITTRNPTYVTNGFDLYVTGNITVGNAGDTAFKTLNGTNSNITTNGNFTIRSGSTFTSTGSTVYMSSNATNQIITSSGNAFNNLYLNAATGSVAIADALTVNGTFTLNDGQFNISNPTYDYTVTTGGNVVINANASTNAFNRTSKWIFNGTSTLTDNFTTNPRTLWIVELNGTSLTLGSTAKMKTLAITAGTLNLGNGGYTLEINGTGTPVTKTAGTFTAGNSTFKYSGTTTATNIATLPYSSLELAPTAATTYSLTGPLTGGNALTGSLTIGANATLDTTASNYNITLAGNWSNSGAFTANSNTVTLNGAAQAINGSTTFFNLTKSVASATTLTFEATKTTTINGTVTLNGAAGQLLTLASSSPGTVWGFVVNSGAVKAVSYVSVSWSDASGSHSTQKPIAPSNSTDGGNNTDWFATVAPSISVLKSSTLISDPVNNTTNPLHIPGAIISYSIQTTNSGNGSPDANTVIVTDMIDSTTLEYDVATGLTFTPNTSALTLGTVSYSHTSTPTTFTYTPTGPYDPNVAGVKVTTTGTFATGGANFTITFRVRVK